MEKMRCGKHWRTIHVEVLEFKPCTNFVKCSKKIKFTIQFGGVCVYVHCVFWVHNGWWLYVGESKKNSFKFHNNNVPVAHIRTWESEYPPMRCDPFWFAIHGNCRTLFNSADMLKTHVKCSISDAHSVECMEHRLKYYKLPFTGIHIIFYFFVS